MTARRICLWILGGLAALVLLVFGLPLAIGIWLPDMSGEEHTLAEQTLPNGYSFRVSQYWNHGDFYTTDLSIIGPDGHEAGAQLDHDGPKIWRAALNIDESERTVVVTYRGGEFRKVRW